MVISSFISEIRSELASIEQLISALLQRQDDLCSRLSSLEYTETTSLPAGVTLSDDPSPGCSTWASVVKGKNRRSLPLYDSQDDATDLELSNFFAPLADVPTSPSPLMNGGCAEWSRKASVASKRRRSSSSSPSTSAVSPSDKRPRVLISSSEDSDGVPVPAPRVPAAAPCLRLPPGLHPPTW